MHRNHPPQPLQPLLCLCVENLVKPQRCQEVAVVPPRATHCRHRRHQAWHRWVQRPGSSHHCYLQHPHCWAQQVQQQEHQHRVGHHQERYLQVHLHPSQRPR